MSSELHDLKDEPGTALCDYLDLFFGLMVILAALGLNVWGICKRLGWEYYIFDAGLLLLIIMIGGTTSVEGLKNIRGRKRRG